MLITQSWPTTSRESEVESQKSGARAFMFLQEIVTAIRQMRNAKKIPPKDCLEVTLAPGNDEERAWCGHEEVQALLKDFARVREVSVADQSDGSPIVVRSTSVYVSS